MSPRKSAMVAPASNCGEERMRRAPDLRMGKLASEHQDGRLRTTKGLCLFVHVQLLLARQGERQNEL
jgi:hypothetical protein